MYKNRFLVYRVHTVSGKHFLVKLLKLPSTERKQVLQKINTFRIDPKRFVEVVKYKVRGVKSTTELSDKIQDVESSNDSADLLSCLLGFFTHSDIDALKRKSQDIVDHKSSKAFQKTFKKC